MEGGVYYVVIKYLWEKKFVFGIMGWFIEKRFIWIKILGYRLLLVKVVGIWNNFLYCIRIYKVERKGLIYIC